MIIEIGDEQRSPAWFCKVGRWGCRANCASADCQLSNIFPWWTAIRKLCILAWRQISKRAISNHNEWHLRTERRKMNPLKKIRRQSTSMWQSGILVFIWIFSSRDHNTPWTEK
jgi:hypothetical protein